MKAELIRIQDVLNISKNILVMSFNENYYQSLSVILLSKKL